MFYKTAQCSQKGGRSYNEDSVLFEGRGPVFAGVVADGLGGHGGGEIASGVVTDTLVKGFMKAPGLQPDNIKELFKLANNEVLTRQTPSVQMKSTAVGVFCTTAGMAVAHTGDSRFYSFSNGKLDFQTKDHSVSQMAILSGEIPQEKLRFHEDRNKVLRALGNDTEIKPDITIFETPRPFQAFLLCTDGFWEYVLEEEMEIDLAKSVTPQDWIDFMTARLSRRINGKNDNFSALAIFIVHADEDITIKEW